MNDSISWPLCRWHVFSDEELKAIKYALQYRGVAGGSISTDIIEEIMSEEARRAKIASSKGSLRLDDQRGMTT